MNSKMVKTPTIPKNNPLLTDLDNTDPLTKREMKAELWFQKESFRDFNEDEDEEVDLDKLATTFKEKGKLKEKDCTRTIIKLRIVVFLEFCIYCFWQFIAISTLSY